MKTRILFLIALFYLLSHCKKTNVDGQTFTNSIFADSVRSSLDTVLIGGSKLTLTTYVYRDFMPTVPERKDGSGVISVISLITIDNLPIPSDLTLLKQYVVYDSQIWTNNFDNIIQNQSGIHAVTGNGPHWKTGVFVDVVCEFETGGGLYKVISRYKEIKVEV